jgi:hypothetical protein
LIVGNLIGSETGIGGHVAGSMVGETVDSADSYQRP